MQFTSETSANGVLERTFTLDDVTGVLFSPASGSDSAPLILMGHGGGLHKKAPGLTARAHQAVRTDGFVVASIDAPGHGDRPRNERDRRWVAELTRARAAGESLAPIVAEFNSSLAERAIPEWRATIDALQMLPEIGAEAPIGYSGMTLASTIGIPLVSVESRITAAVFGGVYAYRELLDAARRITVPIEFLLPWDDTELDRESGLAMFDAFASKDKVLHAFPGGHHQVPTDGRIDTRFFARHLGRVGARSA
ncbi:alpha/beta hydrolase family protein [Nocardia alni]|uniref:alpha/beta hydrolase family protein n=1 Tax=Nocardia alni TaxID=2815723 RepID=UPI001C239490|nr:alpha/beta hydrolase [Nocardia alni]